MLDGLRAAGRAFSNASLRRLEIAWFLSVTGDLATTVALGVYAFDVGGAAGVGLGHIFGNYLAGAIRNPAAADGQFGRLIFGFAVIAARNVRT